MRMKKTLVLVILILIFATLATFIYYNSIINRPLKASDKKIEIVVKEGEGFYLLLERLSKENLFRNKEFIKLNLKLRGKEINLIPGTYEIDTKITLEELIKILETEDFNGDKVSVTIPEGYNIEEIAEVFEKEKLFLKEEFIEAIKNYDNPSYVKNHDSKKYNLEGYLFPDTYFFKNDITPKEVISLMVHEFESTVKKIENEINIDIEEENIEKIITIASLIEEEAELDEERTLISSVIYNRLEKNMKLEFCSTINYSWGEHLPQVLNKHLEIDSPYNTYKYTNIPVGPITNPGEKSIIAAIQPAETDYLYFMLLHNQNGKHHFSINGEEHERVKQEEERKAKSN